MREFSMLYRRLRVFYTANKIKTNKKIDSEIERDGARERKNRHI